MTINLRLILLAVTAAMCGSLGLAQSVQAPPYKDKSVPIEERVKDLLARMTLEEKIDMLGGTGFETKQNDRLGIPQFKMTDGPLGVRWGKSTSFPAGVAMAASWDTSLIRRIGWALARETKAKGRNTILGPCFNIQRVPHGGRNFESFSEDPYLASRLAVSYINGVQSEHVVATPKHYAVNNQEWARESINVKIDERALREIYLPAFNASITEAGAWSIMNAYNKVNGPHCTESAYLNIEILKNEWGFKGFVMSDWGATHSVVEAANGGLDLEMPFGTFLGEKLLAAVKEGKVREATINDKIERMLRIIFVSGIFDSIEQPDTTVVYSKEHHDIALEAARSGIVLLKNEQNILPLQRANVKSIAVVGPNAAVARTGGGGSSIVTPMYAVSPLEGMKAKTASAIQLTYAVGAKLPGDVTPIESKFLKPLNEQGAVTGLLGEYFTNRELKGIPVLIRVDKQVSFDWGGDAPDPSLPADNFSVRWTGTITPDVSGAYTLEVLSDDGVRFYLDDKLLIDDWNDHATLTNTANVTVQAGVSYRVRLEFYENGGAAVVMFGWSRADKNTLAEAVEAAKRSDIAIVFAGLSSQYESEGFDRKTLDLPDEQVELINAVAAVNKNTVVVLNTGAPVLMSKWIDNVPALVQLWYPGQEGGNAIADVLFGDVNPSGKLPCTFPERWEDSPAYPTYPGKDGETEYTEGIFVGYRHFDTKNVEPLFPFGYGLSYTTFGYNDLSVRVIKGLPEPIVEVSIVLKNTATREGIEVVQLYVRDVQSSVERPVKELKGFAKVSLKPGEQKTVQLTLKKDAFAFYDINTKNWVVEPGSFELLVGGSSRDIKLKKNIDL